MWDSSDVATVVDERTKFSYRDTFNKISKQIEKRKSKVPKS
jgi:hypothetical protein